MVAQFRASYGRYGPGQERAENRATGWLCCEAAANLSRLLKFPDPRENTGNSVETLPACTNPLKHETSLDEFPAVGTGNFLLQTGKDIATNSELRTSACCAKRTSQRPKCASASDPSRTSAPSRVTTVFSRWVWRSTVRPMTRPRSQLLKVMESRVTRSRGRRFCPCRVFDVRDPSLPLAAALILL